jgi:TRAP-type C4-dicarboxylate transport system permease small subunit
MGDRQFDFLEKVSVSISNILVHITMGMLLVMMLLGFADVFGRYLLNKPIIGTLEIFEILLPGIVLFSLAYAQRAKAHIAVDVFYSRFPSRVRAVMGLVINLWAILFFAIVTWRATLIAIMHWQTGRKISNISVPVYLVDLFVPIGTLAICLVLISELLHSLMKMKKET